MKIPNELFYSEKHLWVSKIENNIYKAGITDYAQDLLGDIVFVEPPNVGTILVSGQACGLVESVKTGSDLHAPMNGTVTEINTDLLNAPELINDKPYHNWIFKFSPHSQEDVSQLLK